MSETLPTDSVHKSDNVESSPKVEFDTSSYGESGNEDVIGLRDILLTLWRHRYFILLMLALFTIASFVLLKKVPSQYSATAQVMVEPRTNSATSADVFMSGLAPDSEVVLSQVEVIKSRDVIRKVVSQLELYKHPYFNPAIANYSEDEIAAIGVNNNIMRQAENILLSNLSVAPKGRSLVINVKFSHPDPALAASIPNAIVDHYIESQLQAKYSQTERVTKWLDRRLKELAVKVQQSAQAVEDYRRDSNLTVGGRAEVTSQQITEINSKLVQAKTRLGEAKSSLAQVREAIDKGESLETVPDAIDVKYRPLIEILREEESAILTNYSELQSRYGEKHPKIVNIKAEISQIRKKIDQEMDNIRQKLVNLVRVTEDRVNILQENLRELQEIKGNENVAAIKLRQLERDAEANRLIYETFLKRFKEADDREEIEQADARVISYADVPISPSSPNRPAIIFISAFGGIFLSIMMIFFIEQMDNTYRTPRHLEKIYRLPTLTMIPKVHRKDDTRLRDYMVKKPYSTVAEAIRSLRVSLLMMTGGSSKDKKRDGNVFSITSAVPGEGKTTASVWLAQSFALAGRKTLILDCDLRRPNLHKFFEASNEVSLIDVLRGDAAPENLIKTDPETGLHMIYSKPMDKRDSEIMSSENMLMLIDSLKSAYDVVILDSPPCLAVSDSRVLASLADYTVYLVQWNTTPRDTVHSGLKQLHRDCSKLAGFVISQVDLKRHAKYNYGDMSTYYTQYHEYFEA